MSRFRFSNNARTTLAGPINGNSLQLSAGSGNLFPTPGAGESFKVTLIDNASGTVKEIMEISSRNGDTLTIVGRAQEGTGQQAWMAGDKCIQMVTAATLDSFLQKVDYQGPGAIVWHYGLDVGGSGANVLNIPNAADTIGALGGLITASQQTNTGAVVLNDGSGNVFALTRQNGQPLQAGDIVANMPFACLKSADGGHYALIGFGQAEVQRITINPLLNVDPNNGSDTTGDTSHSFKTITRALAYAETQLFSPGGISIKLVVPNAVYDCPSYVGYLSGPVDIGGDDNNPTLYVMTSTNAGACIISSTGSLTLHGVEVNNTSGSATTLICGAGAFNIHHILLQCIQGSTGSAMQANPGGNFSIGNNSSFQGNMGVWCYANGGNFGMGNNPGAAVVTISFVGNPSYRTLIQTSIGSQVNLLAQLAFNGTVQTNQQWSVGPLSSLSGATAGRAAGFLPGSSSGNYVEARTGYQS